MLLCKNTLQGFSYLFSPLQYTAEEGMYSTDFYTSRLCLTLLPLESGSSVSRPSLFLIH